MNRDDLISKARRLIVKMVAGDIDRALDKMSDAALERYTNELAIAAAAMGAKPDDASKSGEETHDTSPATSARPVSEHRW